MYLRRLIPMDVCPYVLLFDNALFYVGQVLVMKEEERHDYYR